MEEQNITVTPAPAGEDKGKKRNKLSAWWQAHKPTKRRLIQVYVALLTNANIKGYFNGRIFQGATKNICTPGLNCYSCPGAVASCPLGSLQNAFAQSGTRAPYYVIGIILLLGLAFARTICGFFCPVGLGQELLYKIKTAKLQKNKVTYILSYLKYVLLVIFVIALPIIFGVFATGNPKVPAFCKYICPAGTFGGALGLLANPGNGSLFDQLGPLFTWKFCLMVGIIVACIFVYRCFCRFLCPLGAIYGFFNKFAFFGIRLDKNKCTDCGLCVAHCKMDIKHVGDHECINCGECISVCPAKAISFKGSQILIHPNAVDVPAPEEKPLASFFPQPATAAAAPVYQAGINTPSAPVAPVEAPADQTPSRKKPNLSKVLGYVAVGLAAALLAGALVYYNFIDKVQSSNGVQPGDACPEFTLSLYDSAATQNDSVSLSELSGKVVIINFWGTWCGPCVDELPYFNMIKQKYSSQVEVIAVHSDYAPIDVQEYLNTTQDKLNAGTVWSEWQVYFAQSDGNVLYARLGGKDSWPTTLIVAPDGKVALYRQGSIKYEELDEQVAKLIN